MTCAQLKDSLTIDVAAVRGSAQAAHLEGCGDCRRFAERRLRIQQALVAHHARVEPDAAFAVRVAERLDAPALALEWAVARLLPVAFATALVLGFLCVRSIDRSGATSEVTTVAVVSDTAGDDVLLWALDPTGGTP